MNKPITIERQETMQKLVEIINRARLPAFVMADMLDEILRSVRMLAQKQYEKDAEAYAKAMEDAAARTKALGDATTQAKAMEDQKEAD